MSPHSDIFQILAGGTKERIVIPAAAIKLRDEKKLNMVERDSSDGRIEMNYLVQQF